MGFIRSRSVFVFLAGLTAGAMLSVAEDQATPPPAAAGENAELDHARELMVRGQFAEAKKALETLVRADEQSRGPQDVRTLADRMELAIVCCKDGDYIKAEEDLRGIQAILNRRCGPDHKETLRCRTALARVLYDAGRPTEAAKEYRQILESEEHVLGAEDIDVARTRHGLGNALSIGGEYAQAIQQFRQAQDIFDKQLGPENFEALLNRSNLALVQAENHEYDAAEKELKAILAIRERLSGANDVNVLMTCFQLGRVLGGAKKMDEALAYASRAETGLRSALDPADPKIADATGLCSQLRVDMAPSKAEAPLVLPK